MHIERDVQSALCVILVGDRGTKQSKQGIARELLDVAPVPSHDAAEAGDDGVDYLEQLLGIESVGKRCEAGDIREQGRYQPALFGQLAAGRDKAVRDLLGNKGPEGVSDVQLGFLRGSLCELAPCCSAVPTETRRGRVLAPAGGA